ncbi:nitroreductase family deazaflavin-dependent oxidoreductase [Nocardioides mangrovicus]|uniref:Nitroreductase family deazaflavin-dependent oxidoreductase n=1 Tax=Nocardioides mangrovicus TaxID=2478913 RepID=A0A3L8P8N2_9ACTN|nr:nitroreductase/quinone reductase family protein [Nocardioides mangrovicus]RLV51099.1 nitroreductase family deazaflavin-dependent oxidoreductase [Nocardioides mangrovicus]
MSDFNAQIIAEFRDHGGHTEMFGDGLVLVHSIGARSGEERVNPVAAIDEGGSWLIAASAAGADRHPDWYRNLLAHPDVEIETGERTVDVHTEDLQGQERDAAWQRFTEMSSGFRDYQQKTDRVIPVLRLAAR